MEVLFVLLKFVSTPIANAVPFAAIPPIMFAFEAKNAAFSCATKAIPFEIYSNPSVSLNTKLELLPIFKYPVPEYIFAPAFVGSILADVRVPTLSATTSF